MNEELTKERDQLLTTVEGLREKLNKATATQQEIEAQRDSALENISQVKVHILIDSRLTSDVFLIMLHFQITGRFCDSELSSWLQDNDLIRLIFMGRLL